MKIIPGQQQFVNFPFFKLDPAWRRLSADERARGKQEFNDVVESARDNMIILPYSLIGTRGDSDFFMWRISYQLEAFEDMTARLMNTGLGHYLTTPYSDDQEFVLAFESDIPKDFLDLMLDLRETRASAFTIKDTPTFTGILHTLPEVLDLLDKQPTAVAAAR